MPSGDGYSHGYSSSSASSRSSSSSSKALARELGGLTINSKKAPSYDTKYSSRLESKYAEPERKHTSKQTSSKYETTHIIPDTSRSRTSKSSYREPSIRYDVEPCRDPRSSKTSDSRYHANSFNDAKYTASREDSRFYPKSAYYDRRQ